MSLTVYGEGNPQEAASGGSLAAVIVVATGVGCVPFVSRVELLAAYNIHTALSAEYAVRTALAAEHGRADTLLAEYDTDEALEAEHDIRDELEASV